MKRLLAWFTQPNVLPQTQSHAPAATVTVHGITYATADGSPVAPTKRPRGRPRKETRLSPAERARRYRDRKKARRPGGE